MEAASPSADSWFCPCSHSCPSHLHLLVTLFATQDLPHLPLLHRQALPASWLSLLRVRSTAHFLHILSYTLSLSATFISTASTSCHSVGFALSPFAWLLPFSAEQQAKFLLASPTATFLSSVNPVHRSLQPLSHCIVPTMPSHRLALLPGTTPLPLLNLSTSHLFKTQLSQHLLSTFIGLPVGFRCPFP